MEIPTALHSNRGLRRERRSTTNATDRACGFAAASSFAGARRRDRYGTTPPPLDGRRHRSSSLRAHSEKLVTPHSGYHYGGMKTHFYEGWYFKVMMPEEKESFALTLYVTDPKGTTSHSGIAAQVMGPRDGHVVQYDTDVDKFWAQRESLALGTCFRTKDGTSPVKKLLSKEAFDAVVQTGFQSTYDFHQGRIVQDDTGAIGHVDASVDRCAWCFDVEGITGWGDSDRYQKATAGWLSALPVFEPHYQVMMSHGHANGWLDWGDRRYRFERAPAYYEKHWGAGFPSKWFWLQCNTFQESSDLNVTMLGAKRKLPGIQTIEETVGMIGIHYLGKFYEFVPWEGNVSWRVDPWGYWSIDASIPGYEAEIVGTCDQKAGTVLRAPVDNEGFLPFCRDSFFVKTTLRLWKKTDAGRELVVEGTSDSGAAEIGGGPWWTHWSDRADMKEPLRSLVRLPIDTNHINKLVTM